MIGNKEFVKDTEISSLIKNIFEYTEYVFTEKTSHGLEFKGLDDGADNLRKNLGKVSSIFERDIRLSLAVVDKNQFGLLKTRFYKIRQYMGIDSLEPGTIEALERKEKLLHEINDIVIHLYSLFMNAKSSSIVVHKKEKSDSTFTIPGMDISFDITRTIVAIGNKTEYPITKAPIKASECRKKSIYKILFCMAYTKRNTLKDGDNEHFKAYIQYKKHFGGSGKAITKYKDYIPDINATLKLVCAGCKLQPVASGEWKMIKE